MFARGKLKVSGSVQHELENTIGDDIYTKILNAIATGERFPYVVGLLKADGTVQWLVDEGLIFYLSAAGFGLGNYIWTKEKYHIDGDGKLTGEISNALIVNEKCFWGGTPKFGKVFAFYHTQNLLINPFLDIESDGTIEGWTKNNASATRQGSGLYRNLIKVDVTASGGGLKQVVSGSLASNYYYTFSVWLKDGTTTASASMKINYTDSSYTSGSATTLNLDDGYKVVWVWAQADSSKTISNIEVSVSGSGAGDFYVNGATLVSYPQGVDAYSGNFPHAVFEGSFFGSGQPNFFFNRAVDQGFDPFSNYTVNIWVRKVGGQSLIGGAHNFLFGVFSGAATNQFLHLTVGSDRIRYGYGNNDLDYVSPGVLTSSNWFLYSFVKNGNVLKIYENGVLKNWESKLFTSTNLPSGYLLVGGGYAYHLAMASSQNIHIGEISVYNRAFTDSEVQDYYNDLFVPRVRFDGKKIYLNFGFKNRTGSDFTYNGYVLGLLDKTAGVKETLAIVYTPSQITLPPDAYFTATWTIDIGQEKKYYYFGFDFDLRDDSGAIQPVGGWQMDSGDFSYRAYGPNTEANFEVIEGDGWEITPSMFTTNPAVNLAKGSGVSINTFLYGSATFNRYNGEFLNDEVFSIASSSGADAGFNFYIPVQDGAYYTISAYVKTKNVSRVTAYSQCGLHLYFLNASDAIIGQSNLSNLVSYRGVDDKPVFVYSKALVLELPSDTGDFKRVYMTVRAPENCAKIRFVLVLGGWGASTGEIYMTGLQVERAVIDSGLGLWETTQNLLPNSDFVDSNNDGVPNSWFTSDWTSGTGETMNITRSIIKTANGNFSKIQLSVSGGSGYGKANLYYFFSASPSGYVVVSVDCALFQLTSSNIFGNVIIGYNNSLGTRLKTDYFYWYGTGFKRRHFISSIPPEIEPNIATVLVWFGISVPTGHTGVVYYGRPQLEIKSFVTGYTRSSVQRSAGGRVVYPNLLTSNGAVCFWARFPYGYPSGNNLYFLSNVNGAQRFEIYFNTSTGKLVFEMQNSTSTKSVSVNFSPQTNKWYFIAASWTSGGAMYLYLFDGSNWTSASDTSGFALPSFSATMTLGRKHNDTAGPSLNGVINDLYIFRDYTPTFDEIQKVEEKRDEYYYFTRGLAPSDAFARYSSSFRFREVHPHAMSVDAVFYNRHLYLVSGFDYTTPRVAGAIAQSSSLTTTGPARSVRLKNNVWLSYSGSVSDLTLDSNYPVMVMAVWYRILNTTLRQNNFILDLGVLKIMHGWGTDIRGFSNYGSGGQNHYSGFSEFKLGNWYLLVFRASPILGRFKFSVNDTVPSSYGVRSDTLTSWTPSYITTGWGDASYRSLEIGEIYIWRFPSGVNDDLAWPDQATLQDWLKYGIGRYGIGDYHATLIYNFKPVGGQKYSLQAGQVAPLYGNSSYILTPVGDLSNITFQDATYPTRYGVYLDNSNVKINPYQGSVEAWVKMVAPNFSVSGTYTYTFHTQIGSKYLYNPFQSESAGNRNIGFYIGISQVYSTTRPAYNYYHFVITYTGTSAEVYINGTKVWNGSISGLEQVHEVILRLNAGVVGTHGNFEIDELNFFDYPLSATEVQNRYNRRKLK